jgi:hypothetical protein
MLITFEGLIDLMKLYCSCIREAIEVYGVPIDIICIVIDTGGGYVLFLV